MVFLDAFVFLGINAIALLDLLDETLFLHQRVDPVRSESG